MWVGLLGPVALAWALPAPWTALTRLTASGPRDGSQSLDGVLLLACSLVVWALLIWAVAVLLLAVSTRLPGTVGWWARAVLVRIAPTVVRRSLVAVVGAGLVTGVMSGCAQAAPGAPPDAAAVSADLAPAPAPAPPRPVPAAATDHPAAPPDAVSWTGSPAGRAGAPSGLPSAAAFDWPSTGPSSAPHPATSTSTSTSTSTNTDPASAPVPRHLAPPGPPAPPPVEVARAPELPTSGDAPVPDMIETAPPAATPVTDRRTSTVTVEPGDTLWGLARSHLPANASPAEIDRLWHHWWADNLTTIGDDPDLVLPGQVLVLDLPGDPR